MPTGHSLPLRPVFHTSEHRPDNFMFGQGWLILRNLLITQTPFFSAWKASLYSDSHHTQAVMQLRGRCCLYENGRQSVLTFSTAGFAVCAISYFGPIYKLALRRYNIAQNKVL